MCVPKCNVFVCMYNVKDPDCLFIQDLCKKCRSKDCEKPENNHVLWCCEKICELCDKCEWLMEVE